MIRKLLALFFLLNFTAAFAQTIKTDVLVIGGSPGGVAAAMQCARSKVKTVLLEQDSRLCPNMLGDKMELIIADRNLPSGIWGEVCRHVVAHYRKNNGYDTAYNAALALQPDTAATILAQTADTVKNLTIQLNVSFVNIIKDGDRWEVTIIQSGKTQTIKARVVIDATDKGIVMIKAGATCSSLDTVLNSASLKLYRTAIAMGDCLPTAVHEAKSTTDTYPPFPSYVIPAKAVIAKGVDNLLITGKSLPHNQSLQYLPQQLTLGQGAGVIAAYCAFFKTTTANLNVRTIQGELLDFKGYMLPLEDISRDPYWRAIQQICATGMLKGVKKADDKHIAFLFQPDSTVTTAEVKPVLLETYTRAFLWFNREKPGEKFTIGNLLSFISELTLTDPENTRKSISKAWNSQFKFTTAFDMNRPITRREFAILANKFLNPFARTVDLDGRMLN